MPTVWSEAAKWHGVALFELKQRDEAMREFSLAKLLEPDSPLTEAQVRPEVARAYAAAPVADRGTLAGRQHEDKMAERLDVDVVQAAIAIDAGALTYAATRQRAGCATDVVTATRADDLLRRLDEATCKPGAASDPATAPAIAHPRPAPSLTKREARLPRRTRVWEKPLLWIGVVGAVGVGVVLAASLWPRDASYGLGGDFHSFAMVPR